VITSLKGLPAQIWRIWAGCGAEPPGGSGGNSRAGMWMFAWEATVKCCGVAVARPQGQSRVVRHEVAGGEWASYWRFG